MTDVEYPSTAPSGERTGSGTKVAALAGVVVTVLFAALVSSPRPAVADSLSSARAQAEAINAQLQADAQRVDALSQQYDTALQRVQQLDGLVSRTHAAIAHDAKRVDTDRANLRQDAVDAYVAGGDTNTIDSLFGTGGEQATMSNEYRTVATGDVSSAVNDLKVAQARLDVRQRQLQSTESQARAALDQVSASRQAAQATVAAQEATLSQVKGQIATLLAAQQAAQQARQFTAFETRIGNTATVSPPPANAPPPVISVSGDAARAVAAAESQIGVPYHWGGEDPGVGFDCSGLTQWSWGQAGVSIPRTAQEQYDAIDHVSLSALEPGDLLFWGGGPGDIQHVGMYVGDGEVIHAPETGQVVHIQPIWNSDLVGAGRP